LLLKTSPCPSSPKRFPLGRVITHTPSFVCIFLACHPVLFYFFSLANPFSPPTTPKIFPSHDHWVLSWLVVRPFCPTSSFFLLLESPLRLAPGLMQASTVPLTLDSVVFRFVASFLPACVPLFPCFASMSTPSNGIRHHPSFLRCDYLSLFSPAFKDFSVGLFFLRPFPFSSPRQPSFDNSGTGRICVDGLSRS